MHLGFQNTYAELSSRFYARVPPSPVRNPQLVVFNARLAEELGVDPGILEREAAAWFSGNQLPADADPIAMAYAGHQFGGFVPQLGDGRAILLGELVGRDGVRRDIQLKGSGRTPFSRNGDGRAALGPVLRVYIISEAMFALGIPTTRSLAVVATGEAVRRETPLPGAVLTRVASSHIRIGTFQFFAARGDIEAVRHLADYVIARHYPEAAEAANPYCALLDLVIARQAELVVKWQLVGFIHGVMNTDNMSIAGETIDYGPCAFIDTYDPAAVYSSIDHFGRYAYRNQPRVARWNLARLAEALLGLLAEDQDAAIQTANRSLGAFTGRFETAYAVGLRRKLGLFAEQEGDVALGQDLLDRMAGNAADFTLTFRRLADAATRIDGDTAVRSLFSDPSAFDDWANRWRERLANDGEGTSEPRAAAMRAVNPAFIPRNHLVEEALSAAVQEGDLSGFETLTRVLSHPYDPPPWPRYADPPRPDQIVRQTFCGT